MSEHVLRFDEEGSDLRTAVGGKAASLGRLARAGFPVPGGFTVTTGAYATALRSGGLGDALAGMVAGLDHDDLERLDSDTARIRDRIVAAELPAAVAGEIAAAYAALGGATLVAVRSSGTAEDMAEASFAGLHDTYLHIAGEAAVLDAVRRCWASMWTARATAYRHKNGLGHLEAGIAVVVQEMVDSEVSGVLFTANPLTARTDEVVVNAAWGLGEGIVSGILTPDEFRLASSDRAIRARTLGPKAVRVVRDPATGVGTVTEPTPPENQTRFALSDEQAAELAQLGLRVADFYDGVPQDVEWALADGTLHVLQSRDVTGVELTFDEDLDAWQTAPDDDSYVWSGVWAAEYWTGAITPLFYSVRAREFTNIFDRLYGLWGFEDMRSMPICKYRRGTAFYNTTADEEFITRIMPPSLRPAMLERVPPDRRDALLEAPFDAGRFLRMQARVHVLQPDKGILKWFDKVYDYLDNRVEEADGLSEEQLRRLDDRALQRHTKRMVDLADAFIGELWSGFYVYATWTLSLLGTKLATWYDGDNAFAFQDLISGLPKVTAMAKENHDIWALAHQIRTAPELLELFRANPGRAFFDTLDETEPGRAFRDSYDAFLAEFGHRGQADRDIYYARRREDPGGDYNAIKTLLSSDEAVHPSENERKLIARREAATEEVLANVRRKTFGALKCEAIKLLIGYAHRFLILRDDERSWIDRVTFSKKQAFAEIGRRLRERGVLAGDEDHYFLSEEELYRLLAGERPTRLTAIKISNRERVFHAFMRRDEVPPAYLQAGMPVDLDAPVDVDGALTGVGTSRGFATGRARVVPSLDQIGRLEKGDILICNATDPGWAPGFLVIGGLVLETGGMLAHGSCLSREYGLPAVQLPAAMKRIEDGAMISVNGETGEITVLENEREPELAEV